MVTARHGFVATPKKKQTNMADDRSDLNNSSQTLSGQTEWVTFSEHDREPIRVESTAKERPPEKNGRYLSRLGELSLKILNMLNMNSTCSSLLHCCLFPLYLEIVSKEGRKPPKLRYQAFPKLAFMTVTRSMLFLLATSH